MQYTFLESKNIGIFRDINRIVNVSTILLIQYLVNQLQYTLKCQINPFILDFGPLTIRVFKVCNIVYRLKKSKFSECTTSLHMCASVYKTQNRNIIKISWNRKKSLDLNSNLFTYTLYMLLLPTSLPSICFRGQGKVCF